MADGDEDYETILSRATGSIFAAIIRDQFKDAFGPYFPPSRHVHLPPAQADDFFT